MFDRVLYTHLYKTYTEAATGGVLQESVFKTFAKFTGKHLCQSLFFNKVAGGACDVIKKGTLAQVFSWEFYSIFKTPFLQNTSG